MIKKVLVVVDMQNDFVDDALGSEYAAGIVPEAAKKIREYAEDPGTLIYDAGKASRRSGGHEELPDQYRVRKKRKPRETAVSFYCLRAGMKMTKNPYADFPKEKNTGVSVYSRIL